MAAVEALAGRLEHLSVRPVQNTTETSNPTLLSPGPPATESLAGLDFAIQCLRELIGWPLQYAAAGQELGVRWLKGALLHGPPGCGKTHLVRAVAAEYGASVHSVLASNIFGAFTGESEERLREAFEEAAEEASTGQPVVIFLDEVDVLCPKRDSAQPHESRVVAQLLTLLDGAARQSGHMAVIAATNRPNAVDPALRRPGRLDREIIVPVPGAEARAAILKLHMRFMPMQGAIDADAIAAAAVGYSGADLAALCREAAMLAIGSESLQSGTIDAVSSQGERPPDSLAGISQELVLAAMSKVRPSITRGAEIEIPPVTWEEIGGLQDVKRRLRQAVEWPVKHAEAFQRLGLSPPRGILLHGPPGCCKTTLARAAAIASGASFQALGGSQLYSAFLGEGEALLRNTFARARAAAPAIIFLDELDALAGSRGSMGQTNGDTSSVSAGMRLLSALLTEMDGLELAEGVLVLGATNRPDAIDPALLRPGRFDVHLYVPPPDLRGRLEILQIHSRSMPLAPDVQLQVIAEKTDGCTGAELEGICREAALAALRESFEARQLTARHFEAASDAFRPALSRETLARYAGWQAGGHRSR